jgi:WhiB family transcriptional regulator, redox-sensing transcriptional regulator
MNWRQYAACKGTDPEEFFPLRPGLIPPVVAALCGSCPVSRECLDDAMTCGDVYGIRAGVCLETLRRQRRHRKRQPDRETAA